MSCHAFYLRTLMCALCFAFVGEVAEAADLDLNANISQSTCTILFDQKSPLPLGDISSTDLVDTPGKVSTTKPVQLTLTGCGLGVSGKTPYVSFKGTHPDMTEGLGSNDALYANKDTANSSSKGFFIVVGKKSGNLIFASSDLYIGDGTVSVFPSLKVGDYAGDAKATLYMGVTCARTDACKLAQSGALQASLIFTFQYQ